MAASALLASGATSSSVLAASSTCTAASIVASTGGSQPDLVTLTGSASCPSSPDYAFFERPSSNAPWTLIRGWAGATFQWTPTTAGDLQFLVWATDSTLTVPQAQDATNLSVAASSFSACNAVSLNPATSTVDPGQTVVFAADSTCASTGGAEYSFFTRKVPQAAWTLQAAWIGATWSWTAPGSAGEYQVLVWASDGPFTVPQVQATAAVFDGVSSACSALSLTASSAAGGSSVAITATSTCPAGTNPEYSYFVGPTAAGPWTLEAAWVGATWDWTPQVVASGSAYVLGWASDGPYTVPQVQGETEVAITEADGCSGVSASASPSTSASAGTTVVITAAATCAAGSAPEYSYFTSPSSSGPWVLRAAWTGPTWSWNTSGLAAGDQYVLVWVSAGPYTDPQAETALPYALTPASTPSSSNPLADPESNLSSNFDTTCWEAGYTSLACGEAEVADLDSALASEGLGQLVWPVGLYGLPLAEQEFIITNEERLARGLLPMQGMDTQADINAVAGARAAEDPQTQELPGVIASAGNWAEDYGPLGSDFDWMYNDGPGSFNIDCPSGGGSGCWVHRNDILTNTSAAPMIAPNGYTWVAGTGCAASQSLSFLSNCDLEYDLIPSSTVAYDFTWTQALSLGAGAP